MNFFLNCHKVSPHEFSIRQTSRPEVSLNFYSAETTLFEKTQDEVSYTKKKRKNFPAGVGVGGVTDNFPQTKSSQTTKYKIPSKTKFVLASFMRERLELTSGAAGWRRSGPRRSRVQQPRPGPRTHEDSRRSRARLLADEVVSGLRGAGAGAPLGGPLLIPRGGLHYFFPLFPLPLWAETSRLKKGLRCTQSQSLVYLVFFPRQVRRPLVAFLQPILINSFGTAAPS